MKYMLLIYDNEKNWQGASKAAQGEMMTEYRKFTNEIKESGNFLGGEALQPIATATTVRVREGKRLQTDGPFAETKEQLGGYYLLEAANLDEALEWAARVPSARHGAIEVRPLVER